jgi:hypothetical protein
MEIDLTPEILAAPLGSGVLHHTHAELQAAAQAMFNSTEFIETFGTPAAPTDADTSSARKVMQKEKKVSDIHTSAAAVHLRALLTEYDVQIAKTAAQIRTYVTNSLIEESAPGSKNRMRALEMLGKISEVGLFTERSEVTIKHQTTIELEQKVREKLSALSLKSENVTDIDVIQTVDITEISDKLLSVTDIMLSKPNAD